MLTYLIGTYTCETGTDASILAFDTDLDIDAAKRTIRDVLAAYIDDCQIDGQEISDNPHFGDVVELANDDEFKKRLKARGIDIDAAAPFAADVFDLYQTWSHIPETVMTKENGKMMVELAYIGEGHNGDYDESDPSDAPLIRFYVYVRNKDDGEWEQIEDGSYCTNIRADAPREHLEKCLSKIFSEYECKIDSYLRGQSLKSLGEQLSWMS